MGTCSRPSRKPEAVSRTRRGGVPWVRACAFAMLALGSLVAGCAAGTATPGAVAGPSADPGTLQLNLTVGSTDVKSVRYEIAGPDFTTIEGRLAVDDSRTPPVWALVTAVPAGVGRVVTLRAFDGGGFTLCEGSSVPTDIVANDTTKVTVQLDCDLTIRPPGCPTIDATSVQVLPRGSIGVSVTSSGSPTTPTVSWTATGGYFVDPSANDTYYHCTSPGPQTLTVSVDNGQPGCESTRDLGLVCPDPEPCGATTCANDEFCDVGAVCSPVTP